MVKSYYRSRQRSPMPPSRAVHIPSVTPRSTIGQSVQEGVGLGVGSAVGQRLVSGVIGAPTIEISHEPDKVPILFQQVHPQKQQPLLMPQKEQTDYVQCMKYTLQNHDMCKDYLDKKFDPQ